MTVKTVYVIRHGETNFNRERRLQGSMAVPLNKNGQIQSEALGLYLKRHNIDAIFSSPLSRARQTADIISQITAASVFDDLRLSEIAFGDFEGKTLDDIETNHADLHRMWNTGDMTYSVPNGESRRSVQMRMSEAWNAVISQTAYERVAIVSHGAAIKILLRHMFYYLPNKRIDNTSLTTLSCVDRVWEVVAFAETPHLNDQMQFD